MHCMGLLMLSFALLLSCAGLILLAQQLHAHTDQTSVGRLLTVAAVNESLGQAMDDQACRLDDSSIAAACQAVAQGREF